MPVYANGKAGPNDHLLPILIDHINVVNINEVKVVGLHRQSLVKAGVFSILDPVSPLIFVFFLLFLVSIFVFPLSVCLGRVS